jgi:hypothetical protein
VIAGANHTKRFSFGDGAGARWRIGQRKNLESHRRMSATESVEPELSGRHHLWGFSALEETYDPD